MLIVMRHGAPEEDIQRVVGHHRGDGLPGSSHAREAAHHRRTGGERRPGGWHRDWQRCRACRRSSTSPSRTSRSPASGSRSPRSSASLADSAIGGDDVVVMAGPCSVESERQILEAARAVREAGATVLRAGAFKPRSSPYSFQGLGQAGLKLLARAREETGLLIVTEAMDAEGLDVVAEVADIIQIGARNMQNYSLLKHAGRAGKPILLKRGLSATIQELLLSAEYILAEGNPNVILCERGVRGFDPATRNLFDLSAIPVVHGLSHLPIIADPSHGTGHRDMVIPMATRGGGGRAPTVSWSRSTRTRTARCPTVRRASIPSSSSA